VVIARDATVMRNARVFIFFFTGRSGSVFLTRTDFCACRKLHARDLA
jgi:hypothetical protein